MRTIKIFLASSAELDSDKEQVELYVSRKNKDYNKKRLFIELTTWKDFISAMSEEHSQEKYNEYIRSCDIAVFLFHSILGRYTREEFDAAHHAFLKSPTHNKKPLIYTFFKNDKSESSEIENIKNYIDGLEHFYDTFNNADELFVKLNRQLDKLENENIIKPEPIDVPKIVKYAVYYFLIPLLVLTGAVSGIYYFQPTDMTVKVFEEKPIQTLPFKEGKITLTYGDKTESLNVVDEVVFKQIPSKYKRKQIKIAFSARGYTRIDTVVRVQKHTELPIKRDNSLGVIFGSIKDELNQPLPGVSICVKDLYAETDKQGLFRIEIPFEKQQEEQRLTAYKEGFKTIDITGAPSQANEWKLILYNENQP